MRAKPRTTSSSLIEEGFLSPLLCTNLTTYDAITNMYVLINLALLSGRHNPAAQTFERYTF